MSDQIGVSDSTQNSGVVPEPKASDVVKYETYSRVLSEAKKLKEKVKEYESTLQQSQEQKLKEQSEWKVLAEQYKAKLDQTSSVLQEQEKSIVNGLKYHEFEKHLGGKLKNSQYATFVDFDRIVLNPETKKVDEDSARAVASDFVKNHSSLVEFAGQGRLPNDAPKAFNGTSNKAVDFKDPKEIEKHILALHAQGLIK